MSKKDNMILLGTVRESNLLLGGETLYLLKHNKRNNDWNFPGFEFGELRNVHDYTFSFSIFMEPEFPLSASGIFGESTFTDDQWWVIRDLFIQASALDKAAKVYVAGGQQINTTGVTDILQSPSKNATLNEDVERVLDAWWEFMAQVTNTQHN